jgi:DNA-binding Lrp family transcriptional regulator
VARSARAKQGPTKSACQRSVILLDCANDPKRPEASMVPFFIQIKCQLGKSYDVANRIADAEIASEVYSTAGEFDLLVKFYVEDNTDIGHFVNEKVQTIPGIQDTRTIITFKAFSAS